MPSIRDFTMMQTKFIIEKVKRLYFNKLFSTKKEVTKAIIVARIINSRNAEFIGVIMLKETTKRSNRYFHSWVYIVNPITPAINV